MYPVVQVLMDIWSIVKSNAEWIFSGIGVFILASFLTIFVKQKRSNTQIQKSGKNSINIQSGENITIHSRNHKDERSEE